MQEDVFVPLSHWNSIWVDRLDFDTHFHCNHSCATPSVLLFTTILPCFSQPDRIKQFGAVTREHEGRRRDVSYHPGLGLEEFRADSARRLKEERRPQPPKETAPPERPRVAFQSPSLDHSTVLSQLANTPGLGLEAGAGFEANDTTSVTEGNHRSLSRTLGEIVAPRFVLDLELCF